MVDGFDLHVITEPWNAMQAELKVASDRATMYALRATGRSLIRAARSQAPVYSGPDPRPKPGDLKRSIKNGRTIKRGGGNYELHVKPVGDVRKGTAVIHSRKTGRALRGVPLYAPKMEAKYGYMKTGVEVGLADARVIYEAAYRKAFAKYAP